MTEQEIIINALIKAFVDTHDFEEAYILGETYKSFQTDKAKILYFAEDRKYFHTIAARDSWNRQICETQRVSQRFFEEKMNLQDALGAFALYPLYPNFKEIYSKTKIYLSTSKIDQFFIHAPHFIREICPNDTVNVQRVDSYHTVNLTFEDLSKVRISNE